MRDALAFVRIVKSKLYMAGQAYLWPFKFLLVSPFVDIDYNIEVTVPVLLAGFPQKGSERTTGYTLITVGLVVAVVSYGLHQFVRRQFFLNLC